MQFYESSRLILLWLIPVVVLLFYWGNHQRRDRLKNLGNALFIQNRLMPEFSITKQRLAVVLLIGAFFFSTMALARPQWGEEKKRVERKGLDVVFILDTSLSMLAEDIKPSRLMKSKLEIKSFIRRFKGNRVGMVAFAGSSFLQCPLTLDYSAFLLFVDALKPGYIPDPGTSLAQAIEMGIKAFSEESRKYRAMIVFSDGEDHEGGMDQALEAAKKSGVRIYTIGVGTPEGEPIPLRSANSGKVTSYKKDRDGQVVITKLNANLLEEIARETGGLYLPSTPSEKEIDVMMKHMETLGERKLKERLINEREDHFQLFLFIAFLFLVGETLIGDRKGRSANLALPLLAFLIFTGLIDTPRSLVEKGNRNVEKKKYQSAVEDYRKAEVSRPNNPVIRYNLGTTLYQLYQYGDAEKELEQALSQAKDPITKERILYNYGNTKYRLGDFEKAIDAYKKALDLNPKDEDAKYNLEFLRKQKSLFEKKNQERQQQKQNQQPNQQQQQNQQQSQQPKPQPQQSGNENKEQPQPQNQPQQNEQQKGQQNQPQQEMKGQQEGQQPKEEQEKNQQQSQSEQEQDQQEKEKQQQQEQQKQEQENQAEQQQERQQQENPSKEGEKPESQQNAPAENKPGQKPLQGQMNKENALQILDALKEGEKELQDIRKPPVRPESKEVIKDW